MANFIDAIRQTTVNSVLAVTKLISATNKTT